MKDTIRLTGIALLIAGFATAAAAEPKTSNPNPEPKSIGLALALGLDGIPGDALFYAGKPVQAMADIALSIAGVGLGFVGFALGLDAAFCEEDCTKGGEVGGALLVAFGGAAIVGGYLWDLIGGVHGVAEHNKRSARSSSLLDRVRPAVAFAPNGGSAGVSVRF